MIHLSYIQFSTPARIRQPQCGKEHVHSWFGLRRFGGTQHGPSSNKLTAHEFRRDPVWFTPGPSISTTAERETSEGPLDLGAMAPPTSEEKTCPTKGPITHVIFDMDGLLLGRYPISSLCIKKLVEVEKEGNVELDFYLMGRVWMGLQTRSRSTRWCRSGSWRGSGRRSTGR